MAAGSRLMQPNPPPVPTHTCAEPGAVRPPIRVFYAEPPIASDNLSIHAMGSRELMRPCIVNRPTGTGDYLIMAFHHQVELRPGAEPELHPGRCLVVWDRTSGHYYGNRDREWLHSWIHADGAFIAKHLAAARIPLNVPIADFDPALIEACVEAMHQEIHGHARPDEVIVENLLHTLVRQVARVAHAQAGRSGIPPAYLELRRWLEAHFAERITLADLAARVHCSVPHFCNEFKRHFQSSAIEFVIRLRLHRATMLLRDHNHRVSDIARAVGYDDIHHFSKLFSKHYGRSPRAMRQHLAAPG
jgi:AraC-like DNA-binding protein